MMRSIAIRGREWSRHLCLAGVAIAAILPSVAGAHITLATSETKANSTYKAVLKVPHGCGGEATTEIRVQIPDGVFGVKPMPKPGWTLTTVRGAYAKPYESHGRTQTEGVREIVWSGGNLPDAFYDEFVFSGFVAGDGSAKQTIYFPTVQQCTTAKTRWIEIPAAGQAWHDLPNPAPVLHVVAEGGAMPDATTHDTMGVMSMPSHGVATAQAASPPPAATPAAGAVTGGDGVKVGDITISAPWTRATPGGAKIAGGYLTLHNSGSAADRFIGGSSDVAGSLQIHEMSMNNGVMQMRPLNGGLEIKPGATVELKPGGYHLMLTDLKRPLKDGDTVKATLQFEKAGTVDVTFNVTGIGASAAPHQHKM